MSFLRWVSEKLSVESLRDFEFFGEQAQGSSHRKAHEDSHESLTSVPRRGTMGSFLPDSSAYELLTIIGRGLEDLMTVNLARYRPTGEHVAIRRIDLESCTNEMVNHLQAELHVSKLFHHSSILPYRSIFIAENELWVISPFMAYGSARDLISSHFTDGMNELAIAYILLGMLKALDYIHHMGYVHRSVKASHVLISVDGQVCMSGLRSIISLISHGQRARVVHDFPQYSIKVLPWLSPEVLQQNLQGYDFRSDIYSLGITACELANGHVPFKDMPATQMLLEKLNGTVPCLLDTTTIPPEELSMKPSRSGADSGICEGPSTGGAHHSNGEPSSSGSHPYSRTFSPHFHAFVELCLQRDPEKRPSASALIGHSFFKQIKRRPSEALPELFRPITPITGFESTQPQDIASVLASLESGLSHMDVDDWDF
ncbi:STE20-related kinase adapter protein alpha isoform X1 [Oncorhynchus mykiss]|uniref:STE20-related kinase adapter protein alpha n=4 Tax=Oncorhynchus mykiss TaxID=8022 RepID=A0A8C7NRI3_ONCMY|nr:STE20-related kinase adapter protein alpha isoform X1 [Oncorhynchus mykiss]XP_021414138.1 STE20-related kinase adapter protein alpha isoform X1 [Oncorhynchus mykiss]XP_021414139.1 STE20-related kinase adapter protein alpha isoform X1 [Oncorhynchus mykiss]